MGKNIIFVSSEVASFAKTGGLADVSASLPVALKAAGANVSVFMPFYRHVSEGAEYEDTGIRVKVLIGSRIIEVEVLKGSLGGVAIYFIKCDEYFDRTELYGTPGGDYFDNLERFILFSRGVLEATTALKLKPDVFHLNDWQSALIAPYLKSTYAERFKGAGVLLTIHNIAY
ncbi:MAG: glycogen/starch synthase, partial [Deltaproteobacteria bacterium]|nr:glycogen/starch synthase [Deltaproteobacteria bacterium]